MKKFKYFLLILLLLPLTSCFSHANISEHLSLNKIIKLSSLVQIISRYEIEQCNGDNCNTYKFAATSTGSIIKKSRTGSYILTTGHTCNPAFGVPFGIKNIFIRQTTLAVDSEMKTHKTITVDFDSKLDICILHTKTLNAPLIKINYNNPPKQGDVAYNYAATYGVFGKRTIPILEGRFSGFIWGFALYTIPAIGGSSGSPIFDAKGSLIGMIHSVHSRFHHLSFSPTYDQLMKYIKSNTPITAPHGLRTEWTDIPGRKSRKIYLEPNEVKLYLKKIQKCKCKGIKCFAKNLCIK